MFANQGPLHVYTTTNVKGKTMIPPERGGSSTKLPKIGSSKKEKSLPPNKKHIALTPSPLSKFSWLHLLFGMISYDPVYMLPQSIASSDIGSDLMLVFFLLVRLVSVFHRRIVSVCLLVILLLQYNNV